MQSENFVFEHKQQTGSSFWKHLATHLAGRAESVSAIQTCIELYISGTGSADPDPHSSIALLML